MKAKNAIFAMFLILLFAAGLFAQTAAVPTPVPADSKAACACCNQTGADAKSCCKGSECCKDGKCCETKDGKMACTKDCCKDMAKAKACCKDGKCDMAKAGKQCCGASCKMNKAS